METTTPPSTPSRPAKPGSRWSTLSALQTVISVAFIVATLFTIWTPSSLFSIPLVEKMNLSILPNQTIEAVVPTPTPEAAPVIGIVVGHMGNDSGSVCADGLTEEEVNHQIATLVQQDLVSQGYTVDLLEEYDYRLMGYKALLLLSIHNDSCDYVNDQATGFKVSAAVSNAYPERAERLTSCLVDRYQAATGMNFHENSITADMTDYHAFSEIYTTTTAAIIETGFLNLDREMLTQHTDLIAQGITNGILCYVRNESVTVTPTETAVP